MTRTNLLAAVAACLIASPAFAQEEGYKPLFNGKNMDGFKFVLRGDDADPKETWTVKDGVIHCTGKPNGYFYTDDSYKNYSLKFDFRYPENAGNSGYLVHITGEHKVWPKCIEVQGMYAQAGLAFAIGGAKGPDNRKDKEKAGKVKELAKPHQEWNTLEITSKDGTITTKLNGKPLGEGEYDLKEGAIGFQSEGAPIEFRNLMIKVMD